MRVRLLAASICVVAASLAIGGEGKAKPVKKTVRADDGLSIACDVRGKGDTALVFLHGWCGDRAWWKHQLDAFADDYRVVAVDQAGHGESGKDRAQWSVAGLAADVEAVVKQLGLKRVILVGHSMGGPVSLAAARRLPNTVVAVIGVDTLHNAEYRWPEEMSKKFLEAFDKDFKGTLRLGFASMLPKNIDAELRDWLITRSERQDPKLAVALMRELSRVDTRSLLQEAKVPVRCINAAPETQFAIATAIETNKKYADFAAIIMEGVGHFPMLEKPAEFNKKLRQTLGEFRR